MFLLRFETVQVPEEPERPESLPPPVPWDSGEKPKMYVILAIALLGLLLVIFARKSKNINLY
jgi:LPXTG-motif cell wall-anchored protein